MSTGKREEVDDQAARDRIARVEALLDEVESLPDGGRTTATELVQALVELYGEGLARIMARVNGAGEELLEDELIRHLLLLHDLHPTPLEERVRGALGAKGGRFGARMQVELVNDGPVTLVVDVP